MTSAPRDDDGSLLSPLLADGRHFLTLGTLGLLLSGGFALFLAATGHFLPHDTEFLGMTAAELCGYDACRIVHFMVHDRVSFGGALIALAVMYFWIIHFPLRDGLAWAWWTILISNLAGFASFLMYLSYGYLDTWHGIASLLLLPCFATGLALTYRSLRPPRSIASLTRSAAAPHWRSAAGAGRLLILVTATTMMAAGITIGAVGMTVVFVPQDLDYMNATTDVLNSLNPKLIPLIAHDRAGFGGGVINAGFVILACTWCGRMSRHLWQAMAIAGGIGFSTAIGVHPLVGYNNPVHLAPACLGAVAFALGLTLTRPFAHRGREASSAHDANSGV